MKQILVVLLLINSVLLSENLRLVAGFYDNRMPRTIYTYKEFDDKLELRSSTEYYENGQKSYEVIYRDGLRSKKIWWYDNGNKKKKITYKDGKLDGHWVTWNYDGNMEIEKLYKNGSLIEERSIIQQHQ